jgi:endonuclease/exonuclease/phosphatase family metal-dependent hydrolase
LTLIAKVFITVQMLSIPSALSLVFLLAVRLPIAAAETFRVATYNLENYLDQAAGARPAKSIEAKTKVRESIRALRPDVIALEEIGSPSALEELRGSLRADGLNLRYSEYVRGFDTNIHVAVLSKFPFTARRPHTNDNFLLQGRRFHVSRGFAEVDIQVTTNYAFTLISAHLKSKRPAPEADESALRFEEAKRLREAVDNRLAIDPHANLVVLGDFNDTKDSPPIRTIIGRGKLKLVDTRPAERNGDEPKGAVGRTVTWTELYAKEDIFSRIDYILLSPGMAREWMPSETYILALPNWGIASDHRPLVATFFAENR